MTALVRHCLVGHRSEQPYQAVLWGCTIWQPAPAGATRGMETQAWLELVEWPATLANQSTDDAQGAQAEIGVK
eukprot:CAMPEP_0119432480 /NCGR_PEP_ID=MMETSP1335-20130426/47887_1 /TAXON_ID=259385 /ORGANISM="Chrysoculter rhomboideus, Strain RCC1486" /LENGTH=72 /DNA_ID=CAMNT_0007458305 /DNA_START=32 /DNA_END=248 /DNA_ORIENTATION=-